MAGDTIHRSREITKRWRWRFARQMERLGVPAALRLTRRSSTRSLQADDHESEGSEKNTKGNAEDIIRQSGTDAAESVVQEEEQRTRRQNSGSGVPQTGSRYREGRTGSESLGEQKATDIVHGFLTASQHGCHRGRAESSQQRACVCVCLRPAWELETWSWN